MTRNHDYATPNEGTIDWHVPLNRNFERIDTDVEIRDTESNIEDYEPKPGAKFLATDTGAVFIGDGSSWNEIGTIGDAEEPDDGDVSNPIGTDVPLWFDDDSNTGLAYNSDSGYVELVVDGTLTSQWTENGRERVKGEIIAESMKTTSGGIEIAGDSTLDLGGNTQIQRVDHIDFVDEVVEIGQGATASRDREANGDLRHPMAIGANAEATQLGCIAIGSTLDSNPSTKATADDAMAIGYSAEATANDAYAIGEAAVSPAANAMSFGKGAYAEKVCSLAIGSNGENVQGGASARGDYSIAIGADCAAGPGETNGIAIGKEVELTEPETVAIGPGTSVDESNVARLGDGSATQGPNQVIVPGVQDTASDVELKTNELTLEIDETIGALRARMKDSGGTIQETTVPFGEEEQTASVTLSSGSGRIATGHTGFVDLKGVKIQDPDAAVEDVSAQLDWDDTNSQHTIEVIESGTSVNPTVEVKYVLS